MASTTRNSPWLLAAGLLLLPLIACVSAAPPAAEMPDAASDPVSEAEPAADAMPAEEPEEAEESEHLPNTLRWTTASEVDNFGFDVYRGDAEEGPFERLTERPMPGAGTTDLTTEYTWKDATNDPYKTYYYYVESISLQGVREQFTPIIRAKPKLTQDDDADGDADDSSEAN